MFIYIYIYIYVLFTLDGESLLKKGLSDVCQKACYQALSVFKTVCDQLQTGKITIDDLHKISTNRELVDRLCKAVEDEQLTYSLLLESLNQRVMEFQFLATRQKVYQTICDWISESNVEGIVD